VQSLCLKCLFYHTSMVFSTLNLRNNVMVEFLSENFLVSLIKYRQYNILSFIKRIIDNCKEEKILDRFIASLIALFGNKGGIDSGFYCYTFRAWICKADKSQENEAKTGKGKKRVNMEILCTAFLIISIF